MRPERALEEFLRRAGLGVPLHVQPLAGGVSSDIWRVDLASGPICVKRALPRLRVAQLWEAPIVRNRYERQWLQTAGSIVPASAPRVLAWDDEAGLFAMEYLEHPVWKSLLAAARADPAFATRVGASLAAIHAATAGKAELARRFPTDAIFHAIRLEPYLVATSAVHADLRERLLGLERRTAATHLALVHGDVSPKNILVRDSGPVFLDAECAWYGDPAFDLAFCLNHLFLKSVWVPQARAAFMQCYDALSSAYLRGVSWEPPAALEERAATLLPGLLLGRVDGKSPVEYLDDAGRALVRRAARALLAAPVRTLGELRLAWQRSST
ncbi:MAG TPA: aminoglycoside phosphotransferase family protein [Burkholderiales bacterium]|nr:aminoglycoside phosphotransferase family protein [Burkholderiales bacterium]